MLSFSISYPDLIKNFLTLLIPLKEGRRGETEGDFNGLALLQLSYLDHRLFSHGWGFLKTFTFIFHM
jgi:hypothetical protein